VNNRKSFLGVSFLSMWFLFLAASAMTVGLGLPTASAMAGDSAKAWLSAHQKKEIMRFLCPWELHRGWEGWICQDPDADPTPSPIPNLSVLHWVTAKTGKFVSQEGELLVSLGSPCVQGCWGKIYVIKKQGKTWEKLGEGEGYVDDRCVVIQGMADGLSRLACLVGGGPNQGFMSESLVILSFVHGKLSTTRLLGAEQGGECMLSAIPKEDFRGDALENLSSGDPRSELALTLRLKVYRAECKGTEPRKVAKMKGSYLLKFLRRGNEIVSDPETASMIKKYEWVPSSDS
jgi:hypothetical protein